MIALVSAIGISLAALHGAWIPVALAPAQFQPTYYELSDGESGIAFGEPQSGYLAPDVDLDNQGRLSVPPGRTIALPLAEGIEYGVTNSGRLLAPYVVVGLQRSLGNAASGDLAAARLHGAQIIDLEGSDLRWVDWDASRAWTRDRAWLESLTVACSDDRAPLRLSLQQRRDLMEVRLGRCALRTPLAGDDRARVLVVVAGLNWAGVERADGWHVTRDVWWKPVAVIVLQAATAAVVIGPFAALGLSLWIAGLSLFGPVPALIGFAVVIIITCVAAIIACIRRTRGRLRGHWLAWSIAGVVVVSLAVWSLRSGDTSRDWGEVRLERGNNACGLIGYSTVRGDTLRRGSPSAWDYLDQQCVSCRGATARYAKEAQKLDWVRDIACADSFTLAPRGVLAFLGGGNDDFFWARSTFSQIFRFIGLLTYAYQRPDEHAWQRFVNTAAADSRLALDEQTTVIRELATCTGARGQKLLFMHDFLIWDLEGGRSPDRQAMLAARRSAVEEGGGRFVDLLAGVGSSAGVSWFNDFIHPSAIGHLRIGESICRTLTDSAGK